MHPGSPRALLVARLRAGAVHLGLSAAIIGLVAALIFLVWYPGAYRTLAGGGQLFVLIASVDLVLGPLLTLVVFDRRKPRVELARDLAVIGALQLAALGYGTWTMAQARPTHLVFEGERFRVLTAADLDPADLAAAPPALTGLPWTGPRLVAALPPDDPKQREEALFAEVAGRPLAAQPRFWMPFDAARDQVRARARALTDGPPADASAQTIVDDALREAGLDRAEARWLPLLSRRASWSVLVDARGEPRALVPVDGYR